MRHRLLGALILAACNGGRVYTSSCVHVGVRPAYSYGEGAGATLQVSYDVTCPDVREAVPPPHADASAKWPAPVP